VIELDVLGTPAPKGSSRAMLKNGHAMNVPSGSNVSRDKLKSWDVAVREAARSAIGDVTAPPFVERPLAVTIAFRMARPGSHFGKRGLRDSAPAFPAKKPDVDKLARATLDSLTAIVFDDDSRIVSLVVTKTWAAPGYEGASIRIEAAG
jgi:Holliday junction resolvase RusA-like endonuclease